MYGRGILGGYEVVVALHGGTLPSYIPSTDPDNPNNRQIGGWAPTQNPMIWLAEGGIGGNQRANDFEIRVRNRSGSVLWGWGNAKSGIFRAYDKIMPFKKTTRFDDPDMNTPKYSNYDPNYNPDDIPAFPTVPGGHHRIFDVDIGESTWPFRDIFLLNGHIDNLSVKGLFIKSTNSEFGVTAGDNGANSHAYLVPQNPSNGGLGLGTNAYPFEWIDVKSVFTDNIQSRSNTNLIITPYTNRNIVLDGNVQITGNLSGGGTGGVQKGTATTDTTTGQVTVSLTTALPSGTLPIVTCTPIDSTGRTISLVITNRTNTNFTVRASIADLGSHQHKIGHVYATVANPISIASENNHVHTYSAYTDYQDVNHNHSIASGGDHTHGITHSNSTMNTGPASAGTSHTHTYVEYFVNNNVTNSGGSHTHGINGNTGSTGTNHRHGVAGTTGITSHTHTFSQMPTYMRETVLRLQNGTAHSIGSTMTMYQNTATSTDLYTENASGSSSNTGTPIGVTFCWMAS